LLRRAAINFPGEMTMQAHHIGAARKTSLPSSRSSALNVLAMLALAAFPAAGCFAQQSGPSFQIDPAPGALVIKTPDGREILRYNIEQPADSRLTVESACYFHPFTTPSGVQVTQVAPMDHLHHRGIFLGWVEIRGKTEADFWGSGTYAPKKGRKIVNREITDIWAADKVGGFSARNLWLAGQELVIVEELEVRLREEPSAHLLDLAFTLTPASDLTLERRAFSGFCVRLPRNGPIEPFTREGPVNHPNPRSTDPNSNWPAARWYGYRMKLEDGTAAGVILADHPENPPALWHNHRELRMLNPCIVAPGTVELKAGRPLLLRYRVVAFDGPNPPQAVLGSLDSW
jgi:hypothetical protein